VDLAHGKAKTVVPMFQKLLITYKSSRVLSDLTVSGWALILVLGALLIATVAIACVGWALAPGTVVPTSGFVALTFGVLFSLAVGIGLMALVFYSSRHDYDEPPKFVQGPDDTDHEA
jgi:hypothetical protein